MKPAISVKSPFSHNALFVLVTVRLHEVDITTLNQTCGNHRGRKRGCVWKRTFLQLQYFRLRGCYPGSLRVDEAPISGLQHEHVRVPARDFHHILSELHPHARATGYHGRLAVEAHPTVGRIDSREARQAARDRSDQLRLRKHGSAQHVDEE